MKMNPKVLILSSTLTTPMSLSRSTLLNNCSSVTYLIEDYNDAILEHDYGSTTVVTVSDFSLTAQVDAVLTNILHNDHFDLVIAMDEFSIIPAARIRQKFNITGIHEKQAQLYRDKLLMKKSLLDSGIRTPILYEFNEINNEYLFPLIVKPRSLAGSVGVTKITSLFEFKKKGYTRKNFNYRSFTDMSENELHAEEYIADPLFHIDGICINKSPAFWCVSEYINSQLEYLAGKPFGSISHNRQKFEKILPTLHLILESLNFPDGAFHLEAFINEKYELTLLEIAARPGGGEITKCIELQYGINLNIAHLEVQITGRLKFGIILDPKTEFGWVSVPFSTDAKSIYLKKIPFPHDSQAVLLKQKQAIQGIRLNRKFYSHERSLCSLILKCEQNQARKLITNICNSIKIESYECSQ